MGKPQIIVTFGHMVAELIGEADAQSVGSAVLADHVNAGEFGLLATILRKVGHDEVVARSDELRSVPFVKPFRLTPGLAGGGLSPFNALEEDAHRIRLLF